MTTQQPSTHPRTLSDMMRERSKSIVQPVGRFLHSRGVHPDAITITGFIITAIAAIVIALEMLWLGGILLLIGLPLDALDGTVARLRGDTVTRPFGAFLDSTLDRYADALVLGALAFYGKETNSDNILVLALVALTGSFLISYTRARAQGLGLECKIGLLSRMERNVLIFVLLFTGWVEPLLWVLAIGTQFTALQRIWYVRSITNPAKLT